MPITWGAQYTKLKTNLRLVINRLKMMGKKKTEMAMKARTEIADYIATHKEDRARIRVEHIIREDYMVEAYEILEMYCDLLLARFGIIEQVKELEPGIAEAVVSLLWAAPRIACDIPEFRIISDQLTVKYGKELAEEARNNAIEYPAKVNHKLMVKLGVAAPPKLLVEKYMILIAERAGIPFTPDADVMRDDEVTQAEKMLIDFRNAMPPPPAPDAAYGWNLMDAGVQIPPGVPGVPPGGPGDNNRGPGSGGGGGGMGAGVLPAIPPMNAPIPGHIYEVPSHVTEPSKNAHMYDQVPGPDYGNPAPNVPPPVANDIPAINSIYLPQIGPDGRPIQPSTHISYPVADKSAVLDKSKPQAPSAPPQSTVGNEDLYSDIQFPAPPTQMPGPGGNNGGGGQQDYDFDDLARRFADLKKK